MPIYAEYWVANELMKKGWDIQLIEGGRGSHDLLLPKENIRIGQVRHNQT